MMYYSCYRPCRLSLQKEYSLIRHAFAVGQKQIAFIVAFSLFTINNFTFHKDRSFKMNHFFIETKWRFIDQSLSMLTRSPLESFAMDDTLCHVTGHEESNPVIRTWVHNESVVLGIQDHRLPHIEAGMKLLRDAGYEPIVRNSGGLAVVLDPGVLNISLIFKEKEPTSIDTAFSYMVDFVKALFPDLAEKIEAYEIVGS